MPNLTPDGYFSGGENGNPGIFADGWTVKANYSKIIGSHTLRVGGEFNKVGEYQAITNSTLNFGASETSNLVNTATTGTPSSYMLGVPYQVQKRNAPETMQFGGVMGLYVQDQWKVTDKLTVNLGLRYDRTFIPKFGTSAAGNWFVGDVNFNNGTYLVLHVPPACAQTGTAPCIPTPNGSLPANVVASPDGRFLHDTTKNFQPRVGLAYHLFPNTAIRAGFGIAFDNYAGVIQTAREIAGTWPSVGFIQVNNLDSPTTTNPFPGYSIQNLPALASLPQRPYNIQSWYTDPNWKNAYSLQWNFGVQQQLTPTT